MSVKALGQRYAKPLNKEPLAYIFVSLTHQIIDTSSCSRLTVKYLYLDILQSIVAGEGGRKFRVVGNTSSECISLR